MLHKVEEVIVSQFLMKVRGDRVVSGEKGKVFVSLASVGARK